MIHKSLTSASPSVLSYTFASGFWFTFRLTQEKEQRLRGGIRSQSNRHELSHLSFASSARSLCTSLPMLFSHVGKRLCLLKSEAVSRIAADTPEFYSNVQVMWCEPSSLHQIYSSFLKLPWIHGPLHSHIYVRASLSTSMSPKALWHFDWDCITSTNQIGER